MTFKSDRHEALLNELTSMLDEAEETGEVQELLAAYADFVERYLDADQRGQRIVLLADAFRSNLYARSILREALRLADEDERFIELERSVQDAFESLRKRLAEDRVGP